MSNPMFHPDQPNIGRLIVVVGGQFGSEGKGHLTAQLSARMAPDSLVIRTGGPNAGHTVWQGETEHKLRMLPTPVAVRDDIYVALAPKSVVDPEILRVEIARFPNRTALVDFRATILQNIHKEKEEIDEVMHEIGSTRKGIGQARMSRIARTAQTAGDLWGADQMSADPGIMTTDVQNLAYATLAGGRDVLIEAAQGYGLGLHTPYYPYTTSADCTALDALADCMIAPWAFGIAPQIWVAIRPYPIRVAGTSGPLFEETSWAELDLPEERTTVTNKVRRVGHWDPDLVRAAVFANGGGKPPHGRVKIGLMMADQVVPELSGVTDIAMVTKLINSQQSQLATLIDEVVEDSGAGIGALGTGPRTMVFAEDAGVSRL